MSATLFYLRRLVFTWLVMTGLAGAAWGTDTAEVGIGGERFTLELAADPASRNRGLMFRDHIRIDGGMLFVFANSRPRRFWMANCLVDMDILFLDEHGVVVAARRMFAEPPRGENESAADYHGRLPRYPSGGPARFAIELKVGTAARLGIAAGDRVDMDIDSLLTLAR